VQLTLTYTKPRINSRFFVRQITNAKILLIASQLKSFTALNKKNIFHLENFDFAWLKIK